AARPRRRGRARPRRARGRDGRRERAARSPLPPLRPRPLLARPRAGGASLPPPARAGAGGVGARGRHRGLPLPVFVQGFFLAAAFSGLTSTVAAVMRYSIVTLAPTLRSPVTLVEASRAISQRSLPFWTTIMSAVSSSTGPVTW